MSLKIEGLTKKYGSLTALDRVSLEMNSRGIYGLIGENGAGKSTMLNLIADNIKCEYAVRMSKVTKNE